MSRSRCEVTQGTVDLAWYAERDGVWRDLKLAAPARRALVNAGILTVSDLASYSLSDLQALHGIGKNALNVLRQFVTQ